MANAKIIICGNEGSAKDYAAMLKKPAGGGYKNVDGPYKTDSIIVATFGLPGNSSYEFADNTDSETWFVVARD